MKTKRLVIKKPCTESWSGMTPQEEGRHCAKCDKTVMDFTDMSGLSILDFLDRAEGGVCGRIRPSQMTISVPNPVHVQHQPEFSLSALVLGVALTTFCALNGNAQSVPVKGDMTVEQVQQPGKQKDSILTQYTIYVRTADSLPESFAAVQVLFDNAPPIEYIADSLGVCRFSTDRDLIGVIAYNGSRYVSQQYFNSDFDEKHTITIVLIEEEIIMGDFSGPMENELPAVKSKNKKKQK